MFEWNSLSVRDEADLAASHMYACRPFFLAVVLSNWGWYNRQEKAAILYEELSYRMSDTQMAALDLMLAALEPLCDKARDVLNTCC